MTRNKAIEKAKSDAVAKWREIDHYDEYHGELYQIAAERAYDLGRIAGLREGAKMAMGDGGWTPTIGGIKRKALWLMKKIKATK